MEVNTLQSTQAVCARTEYSFLFILYPHSQTHKHTANGFHYTHTSKLPTHKHNDTHTNSSFHITHTHKNNTHSKHWFQNERRWEGKSSRISILTKAPVGQAWCGEKETLWTTGGVKEGWFDSRLCKMTLCPWARHFTLLASGRMSLYLL